MKPRITGRNLLAAYVLVVLLVGLQAEPGTATVVAACLFLGWMFGCLHGAGAFLK